MRFVIPIAVALAAFFTQPGVASAQSDCGYFAGECDVDGHYFNFSASNSCFPHTSCGWCLSGPCHPVCGNCASFAMNPFTKAGLNALYLAASEGRIDDLLRLGVAVPGYIAYNKERGSIQVRSCTGENITANLKIRSKAQLQLAMNLPSPRQLLAMAKDVDSANSPFAPLTQSFKLWSSTSVSPVSW